MLRLFKRTMPAFSHRANAPSPLDRMISLWLAYAKAENATAIVIGMPHDVPTSVGPGDAEEFQQWLAEEHNPAVSVPDDEAARALFGSSRLKSAGGWRSVPVWAEHGGRLYPMHGPPIEVHLALLSRIQERLVSLDASKDSPRPMRYIEYDSDDETQRCFAEVELILGTDNTVRIKILRHLGRPTSVRAADSVWALLLRASGGVGRLRASGTV